jgi:hypothetical protein
MTKDSSFLALATPLLSDRDVGAVREQLARILASSAFRSSKRYPDFLRYTVEHALRGDTENIKERVLGVEVFGRDANYDTSSDPVVRMTAAEVRKRLEQYYGTKDHQNEIRIDFQRGSYVPEFKWPEIAPLPEPLLAPLPIQVESAKPARSWRKVAYITTILAVLGAGVWAAVSTKRTALEKFWSPIYDSPSPVLLCIPDLSTMTRFAIDSSSTGPTSPWIEIDKMPLPFQRDEVSFVDAFTVTKVASSLTEKKHAFRLMHTEDATLDDLKQGPAVLIGGTNNPWINQVSSELRFALAKDGRLDYIRDRQNPTSHQWGITWDQPAVDYAIVSRVFNTMTGQPIVIAAGVHRTGTEAAGECFSDPNCFAQAEKLAPGDWAHANVQLILQTNVINDVPGKPTVLAAYLLH